MVVPHTGNVWTSSHSTSEMRSKGVISLPAQCIEVKGRTLVLTVLIYRDAGTSKTKKRTISQQVYPQQQIDTKIKCPRNFHRLSIDVHSRPRNSGFPWLPPTKHILELPEPPEFRPGGCEAASGRQRCQQVPILVWSSKPI